MENIGGWRMLGKKGEVCQGIPSPKILKYKRPKVKVSVSMSQCPKDQAISKSHSSFKYELDSKEGLVYLVLFPNIAQCNAQHVKDDLIKARHQIKYLNFKILLLLFHVLIIFNNMFLKYSA